jgi:predicted transcriptional regulator
MSERISETYLARFTKVPNVLLTPATKIGTGALLLYLILSSYDWNESGDVTITEAELGEQMGVCRRTVYNRITELVDAGLIIVHHHRRKDGTEWNTYHLTILQNISAILQEFSQKEESEKKNNLVI